MKFIINDLDLYYEKHGEKGQTIIILPGWGDTRKTWDYFIECFKNDYTIYIIDFPGFGNSPFPNHDMTIYDYANLIMDFIKVQNISDPILIGHSFGGRVIITMTGYYHFHCKKIILIDSAGIKPRKKITSWMKEKLYKFLKFCRYFLPMKRRKKYIERLIKHFGSTDYKNLNINQRNTFIQIVNEDLSYYLKNIKAETLLIWGEKDEDTPLKDGKKMEKWIPNATLIPIKHTTHFCYLENPYLVHSIIYNYIKDSSE